MTERTDEEVDAIMRTIEPSTPRGAHVDDAKLIDYRDRRLNETENGAVETHLASCAECRDLLVALQEPVPAHLQAWARETMRPRRSRRWILGAALIAAGVVLAFLALPRQKLEYQTRGPLGGVAELRGNEDTSNTFVSTSNFELIFTPKENVTGPVSLWVFLREGENRLIPAPVQAITRGAGGTFRFEIQAGAFFGNQTGIRKVLAVVISGELDPPALTEQELSARPDVLNTFIFEVDYAGGI